MLGALSDDRTDLPFTVAVGPSQYNDSHVGLPWNS
jgi:hypothetical protein